MTLEASKGFLVSIGATFSLFFWLISRLGEGKFRIPKDRLLLLGASIPLFFLISSLFSSSWYNSFFGAGFEVDTFGSMLVFFILFFLSAIHFQEEKRFWYFLATIFVGAFVLAVFEILNLFIGLGNLLPNFFQGVTSGNLVGNWNNFISFFGLVTLLVIFSLEFLKTNKTLLWFQYILLVMSVFFLVVVNVPFIWFLVCLFSITIFVYSISVQHAGIKIIHGRDDKKRFPFRSLVIVFISFIFFVGSNSLNIFVSKYINIPNLEVRPSITTTSEVVFKSFKQNPLFGSGPNTFSSSWSLFQPKEINETIFWSTDFTHGFSFLSTVLVTTGFIGGLLLLVFIILLFIRGIKSIKIALENPLSNYFIMGILMLSLYSWIMVIFYNPNFMMLALTFSLSGVLIGIFVYKEMIHIKEFSFSTHPKNNFFAILILMVLMIGTLSLTYVYIEKFASVMFFSKGINRELTMESLSKSEGMLLKAVRLNKNDVYYRSLSQLYLDEIRFVLDDKNISEDNLKSNLQQLIILAEEAGQNSVKQNRNSYLNYLNLGNIYGLFLSIGVDDSYEKSLESFNKAQELAPNNPSIILAKASLELLNKNNTEAKNLVNQALLMKTNYTDAFFLLAEIEALEGNVSGAIKQAENAAQKNPNDSTVFFRLGMLRYRNSDYTGSISAFEKAVILDPTYFNARYFLGQSYQKAGSKDKALVQYQILSKILPDSQEVKDAINSISNQSSEIIKEKTDASLGIKDDSQKLTE
jgi:tetratricopeptide (TPR) repeat protein